MIEELFNHVLNYDPNDLDPAIREQMATIIKARAEFLTASAQVATMRARIWAGEDGLTSLAEIQANDLTKARMDYVEHARALLKESVDLEGLKNLAPMIVAGVLQSVRVPFPVLFEALGVDIDQVKVVAHLLRELFEKT